MNNRHDILHTDRKNELFGHRMMEKNQTHYCPNATRDEENQLVIFPLTDSQDAGDVNDYASPVHESFLDQIPADRKKPHVGRRNGPQKNHLVA